MSEDQPDERIRIFETLLLGIDNADNGGDFFDAADKLIGALEALRAEDLEYVWSVNESVFRAMRRARRLRSEDHVLLVRLATAAVTLAMRIHPGDLLEGRAREHLGMAFEAAGDLSHAVREYEFALDAYADSAPPEVRLVTLLALCTAFASLNRWRELESWSASLLDLSRSTASHGMEVSACAFQEQCAASREDWSGAIGWVDVQKALIATRKRPDRTPTALLDLERRAVDYQAKLGQV